MVKFTFALFFLGVILSMLGVFTAFGSQPDQEEAAKVYFGIKNTNTGIGMPDVLAELYRITDLNQNDDIQWDLIASGITTIRGCAGFNLTTTQFGAGIYRIVFYTRPYFEARNMSTFYPYVESIFEKTDDTNSEYTVPFYVSPYGYGTYRGWSRPTLKS